MDQAATLHYASATTEPREPQDRYWGLTLAAWIKIGIVAMLMAALFWPNLLRLWWKTNPFTGEPNWGHAICVPIIGLYYLYINREELLQSPAKPAWSGMLFLLGGILLFAYGIWPGQNDFIKDFGMVVTLFGVVLLLTGWAVMKIAWFPIAFLVCAIPWPGLVYSWIAGPLQELAATVAVTTLKLTGVSSFNSGTKIFIYGMNDELRTLNVAEACAGLRSLMTFISVGAAVAFLSARPLWQKITITVMAVPIAIFCNVLRVAGQGLLDHYVSQELSESFAHQFVGMIMLIPAFFLILLMGWVLDQIFVEEVNRRELALLAPRQSGTRVSGNGPAEFVVNIPRPNLITPRTPSPARPPMKNRPASNQTGRSPVSGLGVVRQPGREN